MILVGKDILIFYVPQLPSSYLLRCFLSCSQDVLNSFEVITSEHTKIFIFQIFLQLNTLRSYLKKYSLTCLMYSINQFQQHAVLACQSSSYIRNSFFANLVNIFDVHSYVEVSHLNEGVLYYILLGGQNYLHYRGTRKERFHESVDMYMQNV